MKLGKLTHVAVIGAVSRVVIAQLLHIFMTSSPHMSCPRRLALLQGPIGIEMSLNLVRSGYSVTLIEKGPHIASHIQDHWSHVDLFSTNALNMSPTGMEVIAEQGGSLPDKGAYYSGGKFVNMYLKPLEKYLDNSDKCDIKLNTTGIHYTHYTTL